MMSDNIPMLIVDDEEGMRESLSEIFSKKGYKVRTAPNGKKAVESVTRDFYNIVVLDIKLPDMGGVEVLRSIKKVSPDTEVVIITAYATLQTTVDALNEGAYAYLIKPFEVGSLENTILSALDRQRLILENRQLRRFNENIIQSLTEGILIEDETRKITFANPMAEELLDRPKEEIIGKTLESYLAPDSRDILKSRAEAERESRRYEAEIIRMDGKIPAIISTVPLHEGDRFTGLLSVITDISKVKRLEKELKEKIDELEHFNKLMVGREIRMVELKEKIQELQSKLKGP